MGCRAMGFAAVVAITWAAAYPCCDRGQIALEAFEHTAFPNGGNYNSIQLLPHRKLTVVASGKGIPLVVEE